MQEFPEIPAGTYGKRNIFDLRRNSCWQEFATKTGKRPRQHKTAAGIFSTTHQSKIRTHQILELNSRRVLKRLKVKITEGDLGRYDFIFGRNYMWKYGINLQFSEEAIEWDGMRMKMKQLSELNKEEEGDGISWLEDQYECHYAQQVENEYMERFDKFQKKLFGDKDQGNKDQDLYTSEIKDSKYEKQDLLRVAKDQKHLTEEHRESSV